MKHGASPGQEWRSRPHPLLLGNGRTDATHPTAQSPLRNLEPCRDGAERLPARPATLSSRGDAGDRSLWGLRAPHSSLTSPQLWVAPSDRQGVKVQRGHVACPEHSAGQCRGEIRPQAVVPKSSPPGPRAQGRSHLPRWQTWLQLEKALLSPSLACGHDGACPQPQFTHRSPKTDQQFPRPFPPSTPANRPDGKGLRVQGVLDTGTKLGYSLGSPTLCVLACCSQEGSPEHQLGNNR